MEATHSKSSSQPLFLLFRLARTICLPGSYLCVHVSLVGDVLIADAEEIISRNGFNDNSETELTTPLRPHKCKGKSARRRISISTGLSYRSLQLTVSFNPILKPSFSSRASVYPTNSTTHRNMAPIQFGILLIPFQLLDVAGPLDVLSSTSIPYLELGESLGVPSSLAAKGIDIEFHHIGETMDPVTHTGNFKSTPTTTCATCPKLDYLLIGGPEPAYLQNIPPVMAAFMRERALEVKTFFTTCSGGMVAAAVGLLDGVNATTNHGAVALAQQLFPKTKWTREKQWVVDGKFWTAGGACAGMDMFAHWVMENYGKDVAEAGFMALDYEPRDVSGKHIALRRHIPIDKVAA
jgi:putative intracellular protease/amidase